MTPTETAVLVGFLAGGFLVGIVMDWLDQLVTYIKGR